MAIANLKLSPEGILEAQAKIRQAQEIILEEMKNGSCNVTAEFCERVGMKWGVILGAVGKLLSRGIIKRVEGSNLADRLEYKMSAGDVNSSLQEVSASDLQRRQREQNREEIEATQKIAQERIIECIKRRTSRTLFVSHICDLAREINMPRKTVREAVFALAKDGILGFRLAQEMPQNLPERFVLKEGKVKESK